MLLVFHFVTLRLLHSILCMSSRRRCQLCLEQIGSKLHNELTVYTYLFLSRFQWTSECVGEARDDQVSGLRGGEDFGYEFGIFE